MVRYPVPDPISRNDCPSSGPSAYNSRALAVAGGKAEGNRRDKRGDNRGGAGVGVGVGVRVGVGLDGADATLMQQQYCNLSTACDSCVR